MRAPWLAALALLSGLAAPAAAVTGWFPLGTGNHWIYTTGAATDTLFVLGPAVWDGQAVIDVATVGGVNAGLHDYWSIAEDGDVLLHGWSRPAEPAPNGIYYRAPIRFIDDVLPELHLSWSQQTLPVCAPDENLCGMLLLDVHFEIVDMGFVALPMHTFGTTAIEMTQAIVPAPGDAQQPGSGFDLFGRRAGTGAFAPAGFGQTTWWSIGTGPVQYESGASLWQLAAFDGPTPARTTTWGRLKQLWR